MFTSENTEVSHINIFNCLVYLHVPKEKRSKLDPSGKKGIFVGYSEQSKAYRIYNPGFCQIEINRDVIFDEDTTFTKSRKIFVDEDNEEAEETPRTIEATRPPVRNIEGDTIPRDRDLAEPQGPLETPQEMISTKIRPTWARDIIKEAERYGAPEASKRQRTSQTM